MCFVRFMKSDNSREPMAAANEVFTALWPVVQPREVTLAITARLHNSTFTKYEIPVPVSEWNLREMYIPAYIATTAWIEDFQPNKPGEEMIPELTPQAVADWLARAHEQQLPEGYVPVIDRLRMYYTRARLLEDQEPYAEMVSHWYTFVMPVEKHEDGLWVSGPIVGESISSPIEIALWYHEAGQLVLEIVVYGSLWIEAGAAEAELLKTCLHELEKQGWEADH